MGCRWLKEGLVAYEAEVPMERNKAESVTVVFLVFIINNKDMNSLTNYRCPSERRENNLVVEEVENFMRFTGAETPKQVAIFGDHEKWD